MGKPGTNTANKRTPKQIEADLLLIEYWVTRAYPAVAIVGLLAAERDYTLSRQQIDADIRKIRAQWRAERTATRDEYIDAELAGLRHQENVLWQAWEQSRKDAKKMTAEIVQEQEGKKKKPGRPSKQKVESQSQCGDPRYMALILEIRKQRRELLGLDEPVKQEFSGPDGEPVKVVFVDEALERVYGSKLPPG